MLANRSLHNSLKNLSANHKGQLCPIYSSPSIAKKALLKRPFSKWALLVLFLSLSLLCLFVSQATTIKFTQPNSVAIDTISSTPSAIAKQTAPASAFDEIESSKSDQLTNTEAPVVDGSLIDTHFNMKLVGVTGSNDIHSARAIISIDEQQAVYFIGSPLIPREQVTLYKIMADHVIINNNGRYERLRLHNSKVENLLTDSDEPLETPKSTPSFYSGPPNGYDETLTYQPNENEEAVALLEINRNIADIVTMTAYRIEGSKQLVGYKIRPGSDVNKFKTAGLQSEDIITAINGIPLTKPDEILDSYKSIGSNPITFELERGEGVITLEVKQPK